jgi:hypothetical protein
MVVLFQVSPLISENVSPHYTRHNTTHVSLKKVS